MLIEFTRRVREPDSDSHVTTRFRMINGYLHIEQSCSIKEQVEVIGIDPKTLTVLVRVIEAEKILQGQINDL